MSNYGQIAVTRSQHSRDPSRDVDTLTILEVYDHLVQKLDFVEYEHKDVLDALIEELTEREELTFDREYLSSGLKGLEKKFHPFFRDFPAHAFAAYGSIMLDQERIFVDPSVLARLHPRMDLKKAKDRYRSDKLKWAMKMSHQGGDLKRKASMLISEAAGESLTTNSTDMLPQKRRVPSMCCNMTLRLSRLICLQT